MYLSAVATAENVSCQWLCRLAATFFLSLSLAGCSGWLFYPHKQWQIAPEADNYARQALTIRMHDGILLNALLLPQHQGKRRGAVLFFHGNSDNISVHTRQVFWLTDYGYDVVLVDYRGYGLSEGSVDLHKTISDIAESTEWFLDRYAGDARYVIAHSLGATMTGYVMSTRKDLSGQLNALVLDAGFAEYRRIMRDAMGKNWLLGLFRYPASLGMPDDYDLLDVIDRISPTPLMIMHGTADTVVPYQHGVDLYARALAPKSFVSYPGYHMDAFDDIARRRLVLEFFARYPLHCGQPEKGCIDK